MFSAAGTSCIMAVFFEAKVDELMRLRISEMLCKRKQNYG